MSKRRMFDIDFPSEPTAAKPEAPSPAPSDPHPAVGAPETKSAFRTGEARRGPMATAISENADALRTRAEVEQNIRAENDRLAHEFVRLKTLGLVVDRIPLDQISTSKLIRDRAVNRDPELEELKESIRDLGLSNPIRVEEDGDGYQLVQGFRRLSAYRALYEETGDEQFRLIPAGLVARGETLQGLYRRMVDENLVRRDISFSEMAQLALSYAQDPETGSDSVEESVALLYASAGRQKRSYIRHFAELLEMIGAELSFAEAIPRALGLDLKKHLVDTPSALAALRQRLRERSFSSAEEELSLLRQALKTPASNVKETTSSQRAGMAKTTLRCTVPAGTVRCLARDGRIEMAMERDFSAVDQRRLETAISAFFDALDGEDS
ncbi:ParB/RepB/Spo0J family partition protein [Phaeobacter inhibens]|uniref:ParB/RepB/Spo0J family partition protein n=1 Tax=Phaeobacter inhibens TaxID=221822 RepID=UPI000C9A1E96|nr:ParB N-terminal domain-containing protein [Phaeobacter inhibens]AUQ60447.1 plasmid partitioning protein ParB [Phaeobacter inhibens]AUQ64554.1 plasmid partitioning protein ParB [Phaeobacter inhibens]AUQ92201.1 plasmid partitioning protein ParB [Phaeobacter inhibens]AUR09707.1 plasmid partitioning protein ParB [Phaeobacter inhibens]AUR13583.1 plasmid partitioning protein ParB [Phaeobacter inhibens]